MAGTAMEVSAAGIQERDSENSGFVETVARDKKSRPVIYIKHCWSQRDNEISLCFAYCRFE